MNVQQRVSDLMRLKEIQGKAGNWDYDEYMRGLYNGLELAAAVMEDREPLYKECVSDRVRVDDE